MPFRRIIQAGLYVDSAGVLVGWFLERRLVGFSTEVSIGQKLTRAVIGLLGYYVISLILAPLVRTWLPGAAR